MCLETRAVHHLHHRRHSHHGHYQPCWEKSHDIVGTEPAVLVLEFLFDCILTSLSIREIHCCAKTSSVNLLADARARRRMARVSSGNIDNAFSKA